MKSRRDLVGVPADFPWQLQTGSVSGAAPKLLLVRNDDGSYGTPRLSAEERTERWEICEDLAKQFAGAALKSKSGKRSDWREEDILQQYLPRLLKMGWASSSESSWILRRAGVILNWPLPACLAIEDDRAR